MINELKYLIHFFGFCFFLFERILRFSLPKSFGTSSVDLTEVRTLCTRRENRERSLFEFREFRMVLATQHTHTQVSFFFL